MRENHASESAGAKGGHSHLKATLKPHQSVLLARR